MDTGVNLYAMAAISTNGVIGIGDEIPWYLPDDFRWFQKHTKEVEVVIIGRKTQDTIMKRLGRPLPERRTIVLSRDMNYHPEGIEVVRSFDEALALLGEKTAFVIGGAEIYKLFLPYFSKIYLTNVQTVSYGNVFFPAFNPMGWKKTEAISHPKDEKHPYPFIWEIYERNPDFQELKKGVYVYLGNSREDDQHREMEKILEDGICPFCPEHLLLFLKTPVLWQGRYWTVAEPSWPYKNTRIHVMAVLAYHATKLQEILPEASTELFKIASWLENSSRMDFGGMGIRFGEMSKCGGTVYHIHVHFLSADITDRQHTDYKPVRLRVG